MSSTTDSAPIRTTMPGLDFIREAPEDAAEFATWLATLDAQQRRAIVNAGTVVASARPVDEKALEALRKQVGAERAAVLVTREIQRRRAGRVPRGARK